MSKRKNESEVSYPEGDFNRRAEEFNRPAKKKKEPKRSYWELLRDPRWQEKRLRIMERDGFKCRDCDDGTSTLNVHHTYYEKGLMPWEYPDESMHTLCEPCHKIAEGFRVELNRQIGLLPMFGVQELIGFAKAIRMAWNANVKCRPENSFELESMAAMFDGNDSEWPSIVLAVREMTNEGEPVSSHDMKCAVKEIRLAGEIMRQMDIERLTGASP